uniref:Uncharacterized protein n=2 Tax=Plectus sambesii TaxID=2011161 RepID=A0A914WCX0_9BILA
MFLDPLAVAYAALALVFPPVRSKLASGLSETTKRRRLFKNQIIPQYKKANQKISSMCHAKLKLAYDQFEEFVDLMSCIEVEIRDEKSLKEHFAKGRQQIKDAAPQLRRAYKNAFSAAVDLENFKDHERLQAYNLAFSCQLYLYYDDLKMVEKSFNRLLEQLYSDQHLKGHIKKYLQEKDGYTLKHFSKVALCSYSRKAIYAFQNITNHLKDIVHEICFEKDSEMEKRLLDAITRPSHLNRKYHRFFTFRWQEDERYMVEQQIILMAAALMDSQSYWISAASSSSDLQIASKKSLTPEISIRGVTGSDLFCLNESKSQAVIYDSQNGRIIRIDLTSEHSSGQSHFEVDFDWPEFIRGPAKCVALRLHASKSQVNIGLLALVCERDAGTRKCKIYLLSIELNDQLAMLAGNHVLAENFDETESSVVPHLIQDSNGQAWCIVFQRFESKSTKIIAYKVDHMCQCASQAEVSILVEGLWSHPFIAKDSLCILPHHSEDVSMCKKMLTVALDGVQKSEEVILTSSAGDFPSCTDSIWSEPCAMHDTYAAVYIFKRKECKGAVWILNCEENMWIMCIELMETFHAICNRISLCAANDFKLILHGECGVEFCADAAHIFFLDIGSSLIDGTALLSDSKQSIQSIASSSSHSQEVEDDLMWFTNSFDKGNFATPGSLNFQRGGASVIVLGSNLYAIGGKDETTTLNSCECYDPLSNEWKFVACMKQRRCNAGITVLGGFIYAIGGFDGNIPLSSCERYCPKEDKWTRLPQISQARGGAGAAAIYGRVYAIGGYDGTRYLNSVEAYDPLTNQWTPIFIEKSITNNNIL